MGLGLPAPSPEMPPDQLLPRGMNSSFFQGLLRQGQFLSRLH